MDDFVITAAALKLGYALAACVALHWMMRWMNRSVGIRLSDTLPKIVDQPTAAAVYFGLRILAVALLFGMLMGCASAARAQGFSDRYDATIRRAVDRYWPDYPDWLGWKAQLYQESRLRPDAVSPVGARGLAQFMPATWREVTRELRLPPGVSPHSEIAVEAGAYYMAKLRRAWLAPRPPDERHRLAQASYNAGLGNIVRAQSLCGGARDWAAIAPCLRHVTGERAAQETTTYVARIAYWRRLMAAAGAG